MANCPNCCKPMIVQTVESRVTGRPMDIDACSECRLFWFDQWESTSLAPRSVLGLFQYVGGATEQALTPLASRFNCVRCTTALDFTRDLQRTTAFSYWRCGFGHGRLITFHQFLREKNFIRAPSPVELLRLRETVRQISCSQCGAPIDLAADNACTHCGAPIAMVDPEGVAKAIQELAALEARTPDPVTATHLALADAQIDAMLNRERSWEQPERKDLLQVGMLAIGGLVGAFLLSRPEP